MKTHNLYIISLLIWAISGCQQNEAPQPKTGPVSENGNKNQVKQQGRASWYGDDFHGQKTASGEIFD